MIAAGVRTGLLHITGDASEQARAPLLDSDSHVGSMTRDITTRIERQQELHASSALPDAASAPGCPVQLRSRCAYQ